MNKQFLPNIVAAVVLGTVALSASAQNLAIVNGKPVPLERYHVLKQQIESAGQAIPPELEPQLKDEIIMREIFLQEATKRGLEASPEYKAQMEMAREALLAQELFSHFVKNNPVTDGEIQAEYDKFVAANISKEYRTRHILVESEDRAKAIIAEIKSGAKKFEDIAQQESKDIGSAKRGGDLNWGSPSNYVPEFSEALVKLDKGQITEVPVKSQFGWHVIRVDDTRDAELPELQDLKPQIAAQLEQQKIVKFRDDLRAKAKVE